MDTLGILREIDLNCESLCEFNSKIVINETSKIEGLDRERSILSKIESGSERLSFINNFKITCLNAHIDNIASFLILYKEARLYSALQSDTDKEKMSFFLSKSECKLVSSYHEILDAYLFRFSNSLLLKKSSSPPKDLYTHIKVVKECGMVQTEDGFLVLSKNSYHYIRKSFVEHLINKGFVEIVK